MLPSSSCRFLMWKEVKTTLATAEALCHGASISLRKSPLRLSIGGNTVRKLKLELERWPGD